MCFWGREIPEGIRASHLLCCVFIRKNNPSRKARQEPHSIATNMSSIIHLNIMREKERHINDTSVDYTTLQGPKRIVVCISCRRLCERNMGHYVCVKSEHPKRHKLNRCEI